MQNESEAREELKRADHSIFVTLKYTKTCDVIMNLLLRWRQMIEISIDALLKQAYKKKKIPKVPGTSVEKLDKAKEIFKKDKDISKTLELYKMLRKLGELRIERIGEFRKNVNWSRLLTYLFIIYIFNQLWINYYFENKIKAVYSELRNNGVKSYAYPKELLADTLDPALVKVIIAIEHVSASQLLNNDHYDYLSQFYVTLAAN